MDTFLSEFVKFHFDNVFYEEPKSFPPFKIIQVGDIDTYSGYECRKHTQVANEITYIVSGNAKVVCGDKTYLCKSGDLVFNPVGTTHAIKSSDEHSLRYYYIAFEVWDIGNDIEKKLYDFFKNFGGGFASADRVIAQTFQDIFLNLYGEDEFSNIIVTDSIRKLLIYTLRSLEGRGNRVYVPDVRFGKKRTISRICSFIDSSIEDISVLKKLPKKFGYSYSYLSSFFSKSMGISLKSYVLINRHKRECELLAGGLSVTEVADRMGYSSIHAFSNAFTSREGMSPSAYAKQNCNKESKDS